MFKKLLYFSTAALLATFLASCSLINSPEDSGTVTLTIPARSASRGADGTDYDTENLYVDISLKGDYTQNQTIKYTPGTTVSFQKIKTGSKVYIEASAYLKEPEMEVKFVQFEGTSETITVTAGENKVSLILKKLYTVWFELNGGKEDIPEQRIRNGSKATKPANPTKSDDDEVYSFTGWYTSSDEGKTLSENPFDFSTPITGDLILYAGWKVKPSFIVTFDAQNDATTAFETQKVYEGEMAKEPETLPEKKATASEAYEFMGWYALSGDGKTLSDTPFNFSTPIYAALTLYAKWETRIAAGIEIKPILNSDTETIDVEYDDSESPVIKFIAETGYDTYLWKVDGSDKIPETDSYYSRTSEFTIDLTSYDNGVYNITLLATKGTGENTSYYSYTVEIKK